MNTFFLIFIGLPALEIFLMIKIGSKIGALNTIALIFLTAIIGVFCARMQGIQTLRSGLVNLYKNKSFIDYLMIIDLIKNDISYEVYDPVVDKQDALKHYDINVISHPSANTYDAIIITVAHDEFCKMSIDEIRSFGKQTHVLFDLKYILKNEESDIKF